MDLSVLIQQLNADALGVLSPTTLGDTGLGLRPTPNTAAAASAATIAARSRAPTPADLADDCSPTAAARRALSPSLTATASPPAGLWGGLTALSTAGAQQETS